MDTLIELLKHTDYRALTQVLVVLLSSALMTVMAVKVLPLIKAKLTEDSWARWLRTLEITKMLVRAAEQIYNEPGKGFEKLIWVKTQLEQRNVLADDAVIEAAVYELNNENWTYQVSVPHGDLYEPLEV